MISARDMAMPIIVPMHNEIRVEFPISGYPLKAYRAHNKMAVFLNFDRSLAPEPRLATSEGDGVDAGQGGSKEKLPGHVRPPRRIL